MRRWTGRLRVAERLGTGKRLVFAAVFVASLTATVLAQSAARPDKGVRPAGSYAVSDIENVNMTNGNLNVSIPLASLPPMAGGRLSRSINAVYNSKTWDMYRVEEEDNSTIPPTRFITNHLQLSAVNPWFIGGLYRIEVSESRDDVDWRDPLFGDPDFQLMQQHPSWYKVSLITPDGAVHELRPLDASNDYPNFTREYLLRYSWKTPAISPQTTMTYYSYDGSYLWAAISPFNVTPLDWDVYLPDGTRIMNSGSNQWIIDTNGNSIRSYSSTAGLETTTHFVDQQTLREIRYVHNQAVNQPFGQGRVEYQTVGNGWASVLINFSATTIHGWAYFVGGDPACSERAELITHNGSVDLVVVDSIVLPQTEPGVTRQFSFNYNSDDTVAANYQWRPNCSPGSAQTVTSMSRGLGSLSQIRMPHQQGAPMDSSAVVNYSYLWDLPGAGPITVPVDPADLPGDALIKKEVQHDGTTDIWNYSTCLQLGVSSMTAPDGSFVQESSYPHDRALQSTHGGQDGKGGLTYRTTQSNRVIVERKWRFNSLNGMPGGSTGSSQLVPFNPVVDIEFTTLMDPPGTPSKMSAKKFDYDLNGNVIGATDYDWFAPSLADPFRDGQGVPTQVPPGVSVLGVLTTSYYNESISQSSPNIYHKRVNGQPATPLILNAPRLAIVGPSQTEFHYDGIDNTPPSKGNLTKERRFVEGTTWVQTTHTYDPVTGNLTSSTDLKNNTTQYFYDATKARPSSVVVDPLNGTGQQTIQTSYDYSTGLVLAQTDVNGKTTSIDYTNQRTFTVDPFGRPGVVTGPAVSSSFFDSGGNYTTLANQQRKVVTRYFDSNGQPNNGSQVEVWTDLKQEGDGLLRSRTTSDQLGRAVKSETSENGSTYSISSQSIYSQMGRITFSSNPTRNSGELTDGWTRATKDAAGRVSEVATFSGATQPPATGTNANWTGSVTTSYNAERTTVTDQAGKIRRSIIDGVGRLKQVIEDPNNLNYPTTYSYDVLGNLTLVQQGAQQRQFTYDSVSRLREAYNPEQQMVATVYQYDDGSNLLSRANPNGTSMSFTYDGLNRVKTKALSTGGLWNYSYDTGTNGKGRLASVVKQGVSDGCYYDGYDAVGKLSGSHQITDGVSYTMSYGYDLAGSMTKEVYPSGREVRTSHDNAGRITGVSRYIGGVFDKTYASQFSYTAHGAVKALQLGNAKWEHTNFNSRYQPTLIGLGTSSIDSSVLQLTYGYGTTNNNGNVATQTITIGATQMNQSYGYDGLNRLSSATETGVWSQTYDYDRYGNRAVRVGSYIPQPSLTPQSAFAGDLSAFNANNNRIALGGFGYDTSGNLTADPTTAANAIVYDAENRQTSYTKGGVTNSYSYDGDGRRVKKIDSTGTTVFVYNAGGQLIAEYHSDPVPPAAGGGGTSYLTSDHLGSTRVVTDGGGNVKARYDYLPFGEEIPSTIGVRGSVGGYSGADSTRQKFTQKERDNESELDYFLARYYSSAQGRFTSADQPLIGQDEDDPQTWNLYTYTSNNPLTRVDPDGDRWFYTLDKNRNLSDIQWVNPNDDGTYTSPGEGYQEFIPTKEKPDLELFNQDRSSMYFFGEDKEGGPRFRELYAGGVSDHTLEMVVSILIEKGIGKMARGAAESWKGFRAARLAKQAAKKVVDEALTKKADELISGSLKRSPSYHSELGSKSKKDILDMAKRGDRRAQQMKKLIEQGDRLREKKKGK